MAYGRREIAPSDQIKALRHARDQYVQLADRIHNDVDPALDDAEKQLREADARRIAKAYDRSLSNSVARLAGMERTHRLPTRSFGLWYRVGVLLVLTLACVLPFTYRNMPTLNRLLNMRDVATGASINAPAKITPPAEIPEAAKNLEMAAPKPAIAVAAPAKVAPPPAPAAKKPVVKPREAKTETAKAKPAAAKPVVQKTPEVTKASIPAEPPLPAAPPAPLPAPVEMPAPPAPQVAAAPPPAARPPEPIMETHTLPPYPGLSARAGETGTTKISVAISPQGQATDCRITQTSGSDRLDRVACVHVTDRWRWKPTGRDSTMPVPHATVTVVWNLRRPIPER